MKKRATKSCQHGALSPSKTSVTEAREETVGLRWTASGARVRRAVYFRSCFGDTAVGRGMSGCFDSPGEAHFCSSNSEHAPLDDNKLILIKQVGVSDLFKRGALQSMTDQRAGEPSR